jgi:hypothetical protein
MDIVIRDLDAAVGAKLTQMAKKQGVSREEFLRKYLESLAIAGDLKQLDYKYEALVKDIAVVIEDNTSILQECYNLINELKEG